MFYFFRMSLQSFPFKNVYFLGGGGDGGADWLIQFFWGGGIQMGPAKKRGQYMARKRQQKFVDVYYTLS